VSNRTYKGLSIESGSRHYRIEDEEGEVVFRTTNQRDAETYLELKEKVDRQQRLLKARGIAPHRIYLLADEEDKRGHGVDDRYLASEVVIVAKADDEEAVVVRHLEDGKEEIVDLAELEPIRGGVYLQASQMQEQVVQIISRVPRNLDPGEDEDVESVSITATTDEDSAETIVDDWLNLEDDEEPESDFTAVLAEATEDELIFRAEADVTEEQD
jgi:hypothetical protein